MAPVPLEGHQAPVAGGQEARGGSSVSLSLLIDFMVQRTYHELSVLAELLPRKTDVERKVEIYNFSARTRQLYVRLLALVKWASGASKVEKSTMIMQFLDKQSMLLVDTADMLTRIARDTLTHARLPSFHIPAAVEVLTTGTYSRLPAIIREKIVPPDPITPSERRQTLLRLNQVIQHRLVTSDIRPQMRNLKIEAGRVTFVVDREFEVCLTVMGEGENVPWRLLSAKILVADKDTGEGRPLVHPLQTQYLHDVLQSRLVDEKQPLYEVYDVLHFFCLALRLEVLYCQTMRLCRDRLDDHIRIDDYKPGKSLSISYWRHLPEQPQHHFTIHTDPHDPAKSLVVTHLPSLAQKDSEIVDKALLMEQLSIERLLVQTIYLRTKSRLAELKTELETMLKDVDLDIVTGQLQGSPAILSVPVVQPCLRAELLLITVDTHSGSFLAHVPQYSSPILPEIQNSLNYDHTRLPTLLQELRFWITQRRCEKTLQHLPATAHERLPVMHAADHPIAKLSRHKMFVRLHRHQRVILVVELKEKPESPCEVSCSFYLVMVKPSSIEDSPEDETIETEFPKTYLREKLEHFQTNWTYSQVQHVCELDSFVSMHGPCTAVDESCGQKRKMSDGPAAKRAKHPAYFIPELAHVVAMCDERLPFVAIAAEFSRRGIAHQGIQVEAGATAVVLRVVQLPTKVKPILKRLLSLSLRVQGKGTKAWLAEFIFHGAPLQSLHPKEQGLRRPVYFQYEMVPEEIAGRTVDALLRDWEQICNLYEIVYDLTEFLKHDKYGLSGMIAVKSYSYSRLVLSYGADRSATMTVFWSPDHKAFRLIFSSNPGTPNAHAAVKEQLQAHLNRNRSLAQVLVLLCETYEPLVSLGKLPGLPQLGVHQSKAPQVATQGFTLLPQSPTQIRVVYQGVYCLEVRIRGGGLVSVRDGSYSHLDRTHVLSDFTPTQGLKAFLSKYVDESAVFLRRRSQSEDDNPPSPVVAMENVSNPGSASTPGQSENQATSSPSVPSPFLGGIRPQSPATRAADAASSNVLRFHPPHTPPSNPHTPASPHPAMGHGFSPASFSLASPPPAPPIVNPSPTVLPSPSPILNSPNPLPSPLLPQSSPQQPIGQSPAAANFPQPSLADSSPFPSSQSMASSPAPSNWPSSPSVPRPSPGAARAPGHSPAGGFTHSPDPAKLTPHLSRILPQRSWAGAVPTLLTHEALDLLCTPAPLLQTAQGPVSTLIEPSPLERFLGSLYLRRQLQRFIQSEECMQSIPNPEPGVVHLKTDTLLCRVFQNTTHLQSLHLKLSPLNEHDETSWSPDEFQILEKFFETKVVCPPFKPQALLAFARMLTVPYNMLKDFVQIVRLELLPQLGLQQGLRWSVQWPLRNPPSGTHLIPTGVASFLICRNKILFFLCITRQGVQYPPGVEPPSMILPLVYDLHTNITQLAQKQDQNQVHPPAFAAANLQMKRFADYHANANLDQCSVFPALRDLMANLVLPNEPPPMMAPMAAAQVVGSPAMQSPMAQMHHSPLPPNAMGPGPQHQGYPPQQQQGSPMINPHGMMPQ
ncbi:mediator of RNA polymerase II transcription subunit 14 isoform X2 [Neocloeon triangulifer]|uniref:mediator of RNA polymerase II transcription subunit 14 isoform X2 n=1 Tax=Neocloeon triangulifer TaxID=2078957 RepID=UPI00286EC48A|nr:mediator of RNA polymerase II transcription subunit 14 isoform X2 [Neocloeon triangulifer]